MLTLPKFEYFEPKTIEEACSLLAQHKGEAKVIAGGTDLLFKMKQRRLKPRYLLNIKYIPNLRFINRDERGLRIGPLATFHEVETSTVIKEDFAILAQAARTVASSQIRNVATVGGNLCNASPAADMVPSLIGLGAEVRIAGLKGERMSPLEGFFTAPGETIMASDEVLTEIFVPDQPRRTGAVFLKFSLRKKDLAVVSVAAVITLDSENGVCRDARVVLGSVAPTVIRARSAEERLKGRSPNEGILRDASELAAKEARPISDVRGSAAYRIELVKVLTRRTVRDALEQASGGDS